MVRWCAAFAVVVAALLALIGHQVQQAGGPDQAFYEMLPYVPAEVFAAVGSVAARVVTCEARPVMDQLRNLGIIEPKLQVKFIVPFDRSHKALPCYMSN
jgi:hypothetical protein